MRDKILKKLNEKRLEESTKVGKIRSRRASYSSGNEIMFEVFNGQGWVLIGRMYDQGSGRFKRLEVSGIDDVYLDTLDTNERTKGKQLIMDYFNKNKKTIPGLK